MIIAASSLSTSTDGPRASPAPTSASGGRVAPHDEAARQVVDRSAGHPCGLGILHVDHERARPAVAQDELDLGCDETEVDRHGDRAQPREREIGLNRRHAVAHEHGDAVTLGDSGGGQPAGHPFDARGDLGERVLAVEIDEARLVSEPARNPGQLHGAGDASGPIERCP
jgi:hypothetical protein